MDGISLLVGLAIGAIIAGYVTKVILDKQCSLSIAEVTNEYKFQVSSKEQEILTMRSSFGELEKNWKSLSDENKKLKEIEPLYYEYKSKIDELESSKEKLNETTIELEKQVTALETKLAEELKQSQEKMKILTENKEQLKVEFENLAGEILTKNSQKFSEQNLTNIDGLLKPLQTQINEFKKRVEDTYDKDSNDRTLIKNEIEMLRQLNIKISTEAKNLTTALKGDNKKQGIWGEMVLEKVLEASGLRLGKEYDKEVALRDGEDTSYRPDVVVHLPDGRDVIVDAKTSLKDYEGYVSDANDSAKEMYAKAHVKAINTQMMELAKKRYDKLNGVNSLDFVFMFVPIEGALMLALELDEGLYDRAFKQKVILVSPTTLLIALKAVENTWKLERQNQNAKEIANRAGLLYDKFVSFVSDLDKVGERLDQAQKSYDSAYNKLSTGNGNIVKQLDMLQTMGAEVTKKIPERLLRKSAESVASDSRSDFFA
jgi:DNA recombination protein RmuC